MTTKIEPKRPVIRLAWKVSQERRIEYWTGFGFFILFWLMPAVTGWLTARSFAALTANDVQDLYFVAGALLIAELIRLVIFSTAIINFTKSWTYMRTMLQGNMLQAQMVSGGPDAGKPVRSAGDAVSRFRDDASDIARFVDNGVDIAGGLIFTVIGLTLLAQVNAPATAVATVPMVIGALVVLLLDRTIIKFRREDRIATRAVGGMLGDLMAGTTTIKVNDATTPVLDRFRLLVDSRRRTAVRDRTLNEAVFQFAGGANDVAMALVLVVTAGSIATGDFTLPEIVLFLAFMPWLASFPRQVARFITRHRQSGVAFEGMEELVAGSDSNRLVRQIFLPIDRDPEHVVPFEIGVARTVPEQYSVSNHELLNRPNLPRRRLERMEVDGLSVKFGDNEVVSNISFAVDGRAFVVVTGRIGSGKTTLLRALMGLASEATVTGSVHWNGEVVEDRGAFFVPPNCAFVSQIPQLLSDSLGDNILLGSNPVADSQTWLHPARGAAAVGEVPHHLPEAVRVAAMTNDIAMMPSGLATQVGPRGLRLSGGQRQRVAAARALVQRPELLVVDDLSSALDVATEFELWNNVADAGIAVLAVSHRPKVLERADLIIDLG